MMRVDTPVAPETDVAVTDALRPGRRGASLGEVALLIQGDDNYGVGRVARETMSLLPELRCVAFSDGSETADIRASGADVHLLPSGEYFRGFAPRAGAIGAVRQLLQARPYWRRCADELHAWCQREGVRVLHGNVWSHYFTLSALRRAYPGRYRTVWHVHNFLNMDRHFGLRGKFNAWQIRRGADWVLCVSRAVSHGWGRSGVPTRVVYNGVSARHLALPPVEPLTRRDRGAPLRLVGAGRMESSKGHQVSVEALALLRNAGVSATLDLFGGPVRGNVYLQALRARIRQLGLESLVTFHGYVDDFVQRLREYDIAIQARIDPEPCSLYVLECLSRAIPLVASAGGGTPELMRDGREGRLYPPGDAAGLARAIQDNAENPADAVRMAAAARERVFTEFSPDGFAANLAAFYHEVLAQGPRGAALSAGARRP